MLLHAADARRWHDEKRIRAGAQEEDTAQHRRPVSGAEILPEILLHPRTNSTAVLYYGKPRSCTVQ